jgi:ERF superfamily
VQRSSNSIGGLAAALAKAQTELANPEKSLVGSIFPDSPGGAERIFRYAPLSAGLDIVRKTLGQHEIAVVQTTAIDAGAGVINLTTVLAHASGEWIASDWPVCAISETETPHRMGAALTYARRYALFTLVGIAGEDDLDAPNLIAPTNATSNPEKPKDGSGTRTNHSRPAPQGTVLWRNDAKANSTNPLLGPAASAELRDRLLAELNILASADDAAHWAYRRLRAKNDLTASDSGQIEVAFQAKLATLGAGAQEGLSATPPETRKQLKGRRAAELPKRLQATGIDKSVLAVPEPRRVRDRDHVKAVATKPCLICGRQPSDAHHLRFVQARALGRKASDEFTVPLCRGHHREVHRCGDEAQWWLKAGIDPMIVARDLWLESHSSLSPKGESAGRSGMEVTAGE